MAQYLRRNALLVGCLLVFGIVQAQIYTVKVEPAEVDALLSLKEPIQIPTYEMDGLSEADVNRLKDEDAKAVKRVIRRELLCNSAGIYQHQSRAFGQKRTGKNYGCLKLNQKMRRCYRLYLSTWN